MFIDNDAKALYKIANLLENNFFDTRLINNPEDFFGSHIPIIRIEPTGTNLNTDNISLSEPQDISIVNHSKNFPSGTTFTIFANSNWFFIPFNYRQDERKKQFVKELKFYKLTLVQLNTIDKISKYKNQIIEAYNKVEGNLNTNSMILYSGKKLSNETHVFNFNQQLFYNHFNCGCLYMGDINLNEPNIIEHIFLKLKSLISSIGTLQIPHHIYQQVQFW
ncbi:MAG: hypothetical protein EOP45_15150 [Sphingobacteriaceae bacterium]|nr:MAG: hypothetical protein EOP45_15150 [Sphingobacteriaceae bacterium]